MELHKLHKLQTRFIGPRAYSLAFLVFLLAFAFRYTVLPIHSGLGFLAFYPAMVLTFALCGLGPGILLCILSSIAEYYVLISPNFTLKFSEPGGVAVITFLFSAYLIARVVMELRNATAFLHEMIKNTSAGVITIDPTTGKFLSANPAALTLLGYSEQEMLAKTIRDLTPAEEWDASNQRNQKLFNGEVDSLHFEKRYIRKDGSTFWSETHASTIKDAKGNVRMFLGNMTDITERKNLEAKVHELNRDFVAFLENTSDFIYFKDQNSCFRFCSQTLAKVTGHHSWRDMIGKHVRDVFPENAAKVYIAEEIPIFRDGLPLLNKIDSYFDANGNPGWVSTNKWPLFDTHGKIIGVFGISHDITQFKRVQETLAESEARYRSVLEDQTELICRFNADGKILYTNAAYCRFFGIESESLLGAQWQPIAHPDDLPFILGRLALLSLENPVITIENRVFAADNALRWGQFVNRGFFDEKGQLLEIQSVGRDITDRKALEVIVEQESEKNLALLRNASDGIHILNQAGNIVEASDSFCIMLGYQREELLGMHVSEWDVGFSGLDEQMAVVEQQFQSPGRCQFETRHRHKDGSIFDVEVSGKSLLLNGQKLLFNSSRDITVRKQLATKLAASIREIEDLYNNAPCGYHSLDAQGKFLFVNSTELAWLGCTKDELIGKLSPVDFFTEEGKALFEKSFPEFIKNGRVDDLEFELVGRDSSSRVISVSSTLIRDNDGQFLMTRSVMFDITQLKIAQDAVRANEERFRMMANSAPVLIWISGLDKGCHWFNKVWLDFTGRTMEQEYGNGWAEGVHPDDLERCLDIYIKHFDSRSAFRMQYRLRRHDGEYRWIDDHGVPLRDGEGNFSGYIGSCIDVTESKELSLKLQQTLTSLESQTARLQTLLDNASDGIHILDKGGNVMQFGNSFAKMLGYNSEETAQLNVSDWDAYFSKEQISDVIDNLLTTGRTFETLHRRKDGSVFEAEINASLVVLDGQECLYASSRDISERKAIEQKLRRLSFEQQLMLDNEMIGIVKLRNREIVWANKAMNRIFGFEGDELIGQATKNFYADSVAYEALGDEAYPILYGNGVYRTQIEMLKKCGQHIWIDISGALLSPETNESMWMLGDITLMKRHEEEISRIAYHDILTGLPNRLLIADRLKQALARVERNKHFLAVCYLDLDGFKPVNDNYGHESGDLLLKEIASRMQSTVRANDTVGRIGGDEFVLLLADLEDKEEHQMIVNRLIAAINQPVSINDHMQVKVGASIGITLYPVDNGDPDILLRHADQAMYHAKQSGRNRVSIYSPKLT